MERDNSYFTKIKDQISKIVSMLIKPDEYAQLVDDSVEKIQSPLPTRSNNNHNF